MKLVYKAKVSLILLAFCIIHIFILGLLPNDSSKDVYYSISITVIFILSYLTVVADEKKDRFWIPLFAIIVLWVSEIFNLTILMKLASMTTFVFFIFIIAELMIKVTKSKDVTLLEFTESINAYLLFGIAGSMIFKVIYEDFPGAFNMPDGSHHSISSFVYYTFVTLSTLGYGDITPLSPIARSMSIFFSVAGQLYMAMIVAVLVGKYLSKKAN